MAHVGRRRTRRPRRRLRRARRRRVRARRRRRRLHRPIGGVGRRRRHRAPAAVLAVVPVEADVGERARPAVVAHAVARARGLRVRTAVRDVLFYAELRVVHQAAAVIVADPRRVRGPERRRVRRRARRRRRRAREGLRIAAPEVGRHWERGVAASRSETGRAVWCSGGGRSPRACTMVEILVLATPRVSLVRACSLPGLQEILATFSARELTREPGALHSFTRTYTHAVIV